MAVGISSGSVGRKTRRGKGMASIKDIRAGFEPLCKGFGGSILMGRGSRTIQRESGDLSVERSARASRPKRAPSRAARHQRLSAHLGLIESILVYVLSLRMRQSSFWSLASPKWRPTEPLTDRLKTGADWRIEQPSPGRAEFFALPSRSLALPP
jgi:hypothetical protein